MTETVKVTAANAKDADASKDAHAAGTPLITMEQQAEKLRDDEIWGFHCNACSYDQFSPMVRCPKCSSKDLTTRKFSNTGKVVSYTIQSVAAEAFLNETPFAFAIIQLDDGPRISGWIPWVAKAEELPLGQQVQYIPSYKPGMQFEKI